MKIAVLSDIHDHDRQLAQALKIVADREIDHLILLGDIVAPTTLQQLTRDFSGDIYFVFGNNDGDIEHLEMTAREAGERVRACGDFGEVELAGVRIAFVHKPTTVHALARSGMYDVVLYGHTHIQHAEILGDTFIVNPGAVREALVPEHDSSFAILDTTTPKKVEFVSLS